MQKAAFDPGKWTRYLELVTMLGDFGSWENGEIQIITDPQLMRKAEQKFGVDVGIIDEDQYLIHLRDAVWFPPKGGQTAPKLGTYIRLVYTNQLRGNVGVCVLPITMEGDLILNRSYRHALRGWTVETAGTIGKLDESWSESVTRCIKDELGCPVLYIVQLTDGFIPERGLVGGVVPICLARVDFDEGAQIEGPVVRGHDVLSVEQFWSAVTSGFWQAPGLPMHRCCDSYTIAAVRLAELHQFI